MNCSWKEEDAYRFAEGTLDAMRRAAFGEHLAGCVTCQARVAQARRVEGLLQGAVTRVAAPATLASRVANAVAAEREERRAGRGLQLFGRRLSPLFVGVAAVLVLAVASYVVAPGAVMALAQRVLFFVPGLGIKPAGEGTLVAIAPVTVQSGKLTFTVEALLSDGTRTTVKFELSGLPGGKAGWETQHPGPRQPLLRDAEGRTYALATAFFGGVGGSPDENIISGEMHFAPLPAGLQSVDLVVPLDYYVPPAVVPGTDQLELVAHVALTPADQSDLPAATPQSAEATANGVTLKVSASSVEDGRTVLLAEGEAAGAARLVALGRMGGSADEAATLRDNRGREYRLVPQGSEVTVGGQPLRKDLYFEPVAAGATQLTLAVPAVQVEEQGAVDVTIPLAGHNMGETLELNRTVDLGGYKVLLETATLAEDGGQPWLYVDLKLPTSANGRTLASFNAQRAGGSASMWSMDGGEQLSDFGVPIEAGAKEVTIHIDKPIVDVEGPWEVTFPAGQ